jgi:hypothetical protein
MKNLELNKMETLQGGEVTNEEACIAAMGIGTVFIASGFLSWAGAAIVVIASVGACAVE